MKPKIKSIKELEHQIALGTVKLGQDIPKRIGTYTKTYRLLIRGRIHDMLQAATKFNGPIPRTELSKVASTQYSSRHISYAEVLGLLKRTSVYERHNGRKLFFNITKTGRQALAILNNNNINKWGSFKVVPVKVNRKAYLYYATKTS